MNEQAPQDEMELRRELADRVAADSALKRTERECSISTSCAEEQVHILAEHRTWMRRVLEHSYASIRWIRYETSEGIGYTDNRDHLLDIPEGANVVGVAAEMPVGCLTLKGAPRTSNRLSAVVNTPAQAEKASEAFNNDD